MRRAALMLLSSAVVTALAAPLPFHDATERRGLQGAWVWVATRGYNSGGGRSPADLDVQVRFTGDRVTYYCFGEALTTWAVTLDTKKSPREMNLRYVGGAAKGSVRASIAAIYRVDGDSLTIASAEGMDGKRPTDFEGTKKGESVNTYKRKVNR